MHSIDSTLATIALLLWVPFSVVLFANLPSHRAASVCLFGGLLFLPSAQVLLVPLLPDLDRRTIPLACVVVCNALMKKQLFRGVRLGALPLTCFFLFAISDISRVLGNMDDLRVGPTAIVPGLLPQTIITFLLDDALLAAMFVLGVSFGSEPERLRTLLRTWYMSALLYAPLVAIEVRMSPQVHLWVYGYMQHDFMQLIREGGWRPMVFMSHGLEVALFVAASVSVALALGNSQMKAFGVRPRLASWLLMVLLVLCKSSAALVYGTLAFIMSKLGPKRTLLVVRALVLLILTYPLMRLGGWITAETPRELSNLFDTDRIESIVFRMLNEDMMLEKLQERPWTGWGGFGRIGTFDPETGAPLTIPDGSWIIETSSGGVPRFLAMFALLTIPAFSMRRLVNRTSVTALLDAKLFAALALTSIVMVLDLLPNGMFNFFAFLAAGVVYGISQRMTVDPVAYWPVMMRPR